MTEGTGRRRVLLKLSGEAFGGGQLGVNPDIDFQSCNMQVNQAFALQGDGARNRAKLLPDLIHSGIKLLIYAGDADMACNYIVRRVAPCPLFSH